MATTAPKAGLEGMVAGDTAIATVQQDKLIYRGYEIHDLADHATFEEVAFLLLEGHKPDASEIARFRDELIANRAVPTSVQEFLKKSGSMLKQKTATPMDVLRTCVSILGNVDADSQKNTPEANLWKSKRLLAKIPTIIGHMQNVIDGRDLVAPETGGDANLSHAANLLYMMAGEKPSDEAARVMDVSLILYAEHDFNASTFTGRVIAATLSDMHGAVTGAVAALKGPLHGGANEQAMEMLREIKKAKDGGTSVSDWMDDAFERKKKLMGFGHRVYKNGDHRAPILHKMGRSLAEKRGGEFLEYFEIGEEVQRIMEEKKGIFPNVDFPCGLTYFTMGIPVAQYTPIFVASRVSGWCAHIMEQHANNRLIRPIANYVGEGLRDWGG